jgi:hypothetical protein
VYEGFRGVLVHWLLARPEREKRIFRSAAGKGACVTTHARPNEFAQFAKCYVFVTYVVISGTVATGVTEAIQSYLLRGLPKSSAQRGAVAPHYAHNDYAPAVPTTAARSSV